MLPADVLLSTQPPAVALVGTTASGKSSLAMSVARRAGDVELVCVDSMTVYRGMDIGTAKPTPEDRATVPHHLLDLVEATREFTVREFQAAAAAAREDIARRGRRTLLVGGTGLYLRAAVDDLCIPERYPDVAAVLEREAELPDGVRALHDRLATLDPLAASRTTDSNRRRIVRALEVTIGSGRPFSSYGPGLSVYAPTDVQLVGLPFDPEVVDRRIAERFGRWVEEGLVEEVRRLAALPQGLSRTARQALGYKELLGHVERGVPLEESVNEAVRRTRAFARRQWAWFRRDPRIRWIGDDEDPVGVLSAALDGALDGAADVTPGGPALHPGRRGAHGRQGAHGRRRPGARLVTMVQAPDRRPPRPPRAAPQALAARSTAGDSLPMMKLEAAGNDFLVLLDPWPHEDALLTPAAVRSVCDRHRGIGADGLIIGRRWTSVAKSAPGLPPPARRDLRMTLYNADGTEAEMSGNGIRCFVHAAVLLGVVDAGCVHVETAAGLRTVAYESRDDGAGWARVDMGPVRLGSEVESPLPGTRARLADVGNPHLVVIGDVELESLDLGSLEAWAVRAAGGPVNIEVVRPGRAGADLDLRVSERGVGETLACGTGTCAAAAVANALGDTGETVTVDNPGGRLEVRLGPDGAELGGPVRKVADVAFDETFLRASEDFMRPSDGDG